MVHMHKSYIIELKLQCLLAEMGEKGWASDPTPVIKLKIDHCMLLLNTHKLKTQRVNVLHPHHFPNNYC